MSETNKALARQVIEQLWNQKDGAVIDQLYAQNYTGHTPDGELQGHAGVRQHHNRYITAFPDTQIAIDDMVAEGDKVVILWTATATHRGELAGIAPTGNRVNVSGSLVMRFAGGQVIEEHTLWDTLKLAQQIGAVGQARSVSAG